MYIGPIIFQGEELGLPQPELDFHELKDPWGLNLYPDFPGRDGVRTPIPWDTSEQGGFTDGDSPWLPLADIHRPLNVAAQKDNEGSVLRFFIDFVHWRQTKPIIKWGQQSIPELKYSPILSIQRYDAQTLYWFFLNFTNRTQTRPFPEGAKLLKIPGQDADHNNNTIIFPPWGFAGVEIENSGELE